MSKMWEVDPETRSKASPKFGTFICLNCAGTHRGLGVHISFVRSITMDAFKLAETQRMDLGGNDPWKSFFDNHELNVAEGKNFEECTIKERYEGEVGEEWKERLSAKVEGREYVKVERKREAVQQPMRAVTPTPEMEGSSRPGPGQSGVGATTTKKEMNEAYFAKLGADNASRADHLPPSQGGKFAGFGGGMPEPQQSSGRQGGGGAGVPGIDEFQTDPVAALTKGFGWFTTTIGKGAKTVSEGYIQPAAKTIAQSDLASHARTAATEVSRGLQTGVRGATDSLSRFVEGPDGQQQQPRQQRGSSREPERKDFWDEFSSVGEERSRRAAGAGAGAGSGAIGTAAMRRSNTTTATTASSAAAAGKKKDDGGWDDNW
ncbi:hypothetical protein AJ80_03617 [Polytolypa hystricis UAMH7299]|uniref:Arf-GAP domain-containing protein n=1 Tax=Polytolypa hystricis (strain UAMH7299) TaxID=1447883 RepID=A0A2B7YGZ6_POLH7|nr:hypothetical protein AJ80_03617 [Polytolypa hystricis UAMH7299]